jgi:hypothetical protein
MRTPVTVKKIVRGTGQPSTPFGSTFAAVARSYVVLEHLRLVIVNLLSFQNEQLGAVLADTLRSAVETSRVHTKFPIYSQYFHLSGYATTNIPATTVVDNSVQQSRQQAS